MRITVEKEEKENARMIEINTSGNAHSCKSEKWNKEKFDMTLMNINGYAHYRRKKRKENARMIEINTNGDAHLSQDKKTEKVWYDVDEYKWLCASL